MTFVLSIALKAVNMVGRAANVRILEAQHGTEYWSALGVPFRKILVPCVLSTHDVQEVYFALHCQSPRASALCQ